MTREDFRIVFWKEYLLLEKNFIAMDEYVAIHKDNFKTFSSAYTNMFLSICSEMDSIAYEYCKIIENDEMDKHLTIVRKISKIVNRNQSIKTKRVITNNLFQKINLVPFDTFSDNGVAGWWKDYNLVKHERANKTENGMPNYQKANLKNVLSALAALYILCVCLYEELEDDGETLEGSKLFGSIM